MQIILCVVTCALAGLHAFVAAMHLKNGQPSPRDWWMMLGAVLAMVGGVLCLMGSPVDWLAALAGFALIATAALANGQQKQQLHIPHHIMRISLFGLLIIGLLLV